MTIHEAGNQLVSRLQQLYDGREAKSIADWVMEHLTGWDRPGRIVHKKEPLSQKQLHDLQGITQQLMAHKPVHYVLNQAWFRGMKLYVNEHVLIPRPETEELVEWVLEALQSPYMQPDKLKILDIGTGSGCIPIALKKALPKAELFGCDISEEALKVAARNAAEQSAGVYFLQANFLDKPEREELPMAHVIVSNPPYIAIREQAAIDRHVLEYEPHLALFVPDDDPLVFYEHLAEFGHSHLHPPGFMIVEIHYDKGAEVKALFEANGYEAEVRKDMHGHERLVKVTLHPSYQPSALFSPPGRGPRA